MRLAAFALGVTLLASPVHASPVEALGKALAAMRSGDWETATSSARGAGAAGETLIEWHRLRAGRGTFNEARAFLSQHGDWPGLKLLRRRAEAKIPAAAAPPQVRTYFETEAPQTGQGALRLAQALAKLGATEEAEGEIVRAWRTLSLSAAVEKAYLKDYRALLRPHHEARLDMLLWSGETTAAERMLPRVSDAWQKLAQARIALRNDRPGVDVLIEKVPAVLRDDPGLAYERFDWRARRGRSDSALEILLARSTSAEALGRPSAWAERRRVYARAKMRASDARAAYKIAANHFVTEGYVQADLEWISGFVALRQLDDPDTALRHFRKFRTLVWTPISLGRAGYWEGRAHEALGDMVSAQAAYEFGGEFQTSFYGLLAAEKAGLPMNDTLTGRETFPPWDTAAFATSSVFQAGRLLLEAGERSLGERFLVHLSESLSREEQGALADFALSIDEPHVALMIAKQAARQGRVIEKAYFPVTELADQKHPVPLELTLAIARRESEFDPVVVSPAGARGLMQLMPRTAQTVARGLSMPYQLGKLTSDPGYNAKLGTAYLAELIDEFGPTYPLVAAGYNAGPGRPIRWMSLYGDPRRAHVDAVDWIEFIPFRETRNYVMRVMESLPVYRARLTGETAPLSLSSELKGGVNVPRPAARAIR